MDQNITTVQQVAVKVLELIPDETRWIKHTPQQGDRICVATAVGKLNAVPARVQFAQLFVHTALEQHPGRYNGVAHDVIGVNDHPATTYAEIRAILEKIAAG